LATPPCGSYTGLPSIAMLMAKKEGYWLVLLISFATLSIRGLIVVHAAPAAALAGAH
jgi:hypothetical protein